MDTKRKEKHMSKKRGQGEGSIYKRKDGLWIAQVSIQGHRISKYTKTQSEGLNWLHKMCTQVQAGMTLEGAQRPFSEYLQQWLILIQGSIRPNTLIQYSQIVRDHILPQLGRIKLKDLRPDQIQILYSEKLRQGTSSRTVILIHAVLHKALKQAVRLGTIVANPADAVTRPKFRRKEMKTLSDMEAQKLLVAARGTSLEAVYWLAVSTGLRQGELLGLRWSDLDWKKQSLQIQRQLQRQALGLVFTEPKSAAGRRMIILGTVTLEKLRVHQNLQVEERKLAGDTWQENDLIFPSSIGTPMDPSNLYHHFKRLLKEAGLPDIRFHDLRHTAATLMLQQGTHPKIVQERLGHSDISLTLNVYSHVLPSMQEETAEKMDELLTPIDISDELKKIEEQIGAYETQTNNEI